MAQPSSYNSVFGSPGGLGFDARAHNLYQVKYLQKNSSSSDNNNKSCTSIREEEDESSCSDDAMVMEQHDRKPAIEGFASQGIMRTGLMRYHSAPSSMLASLVGLEDDFLEQEAEFSRLFPDDVADFESKMVSHSDMDKSRTYSNGIRQGPGGGGSRDFESKMASHFDMDKTHFYSNGNEAKAVDAAPTPITTAAHESSHCIRFASPHPRFKQAPLVNHSDTPNPVGIGVNGESPGLKPHPMPNSHGERLSRMAMDFQEEKPSLNSSSMPSSHGEHLPRMTMNFQGENLDSNHSSNSNMHANAMPSSYGEPLSQMAIEVRGENPNLCFSTPMHPPDCLVNSATAPRAAPYPFPMRNSSVSGNLPSENGDTVVLGRNRSRVSPPSRNGLLRHSSSPAGFLLQLNDGLADNEKLLLSSSSGNSSEEGSFERRRGPPIYESYAQWDESVAAGPSNGVAFASRKRTRELEDRFFTNPSSIPDSQQRDAIEHDALLAHHFSLHSCENPYFTDTMSHDSVPCRTRAKRGCATHPRSIAERVRRTKISERMKRLQDLVPNMDKQTNTAAMLDEAVEYVKHLQERVQELTEEQSECCCSCKQQESTSSQ